MVQLTAEFTGDCEQNTTKHIKNLQKISETNAVERYL